MESKASTSSFLMNMFLLGISLSVLTNPLTGKCHTYGGFVAREYDRRMVIFFVGNRGRMTFFFCVYRCVVYLLLEYRGMVVCNVLK